MKKVLIITYYWPPSGGAGVQRWLRMVKHIRKFGWEPVIYTPDEADYPVYDHNLVNTIPKDVETLRHKIIEPNSIIKKLYFWKKNNETEIYKIQEMKGDKRSPFQKLIWFIRGNVFFPDARSMWIKPSIKFLSNYLSHNHIDLIVSTGPPHSMHMIALELKNQFQIPWLADFRDLWSSMDYLQEMFLTKWAWKKQLKMEKEVLSSADRVVVVGRTMYNEFFEDHNVKSTILHNGYDDATQYQGSTGLDKKFTIVHIGSFKKNRNCADLWKVLEKMTKEDTSFAEKLEIKLIGNTEEPVIKSVKEHGLESHLNNISYIPFEETQSHLHGAQVLLLPIDRIPNAEFVLTGKLFEYLKAKRPILLIGPANGDAADVIQNCKAGYSCDFDDEDAIHQAVRDAYQKYLEDKNKVNSQNIENYSAYELTKKLATIMDETLTKTKSDQLMAVD